MTKPTPNTPNMPNEPSKNPVRKLRHALGRLVYGITHTDEELTNLQTFVLRSYGLFRHARIRLVANNAPMMAAALSYRTLFSIIPVLVLSIVVLQAFVTEQRIHDLIDNAMQATGLSELVVPAEGEPVAATGEAQPVDAQNTSAQSTGAQSTQAGPEEQVNLTEWIKDLVFRAQAYLSTISFTSIAVVGALLFIYAAMSLIFQIEQSFNTVMQAPARRSMVVRIIYAWTILTLGSVAAAASVGITSGFIESAGDYSEGFGIAKGIVQTAMHLLVTILLLFGAYKLIPSARVENRAALFGAIVAATAFELGKNGLVWFVREGTGGQVAIYGSLALVPLFLLWTYVTWLIVLFGLQVAHSIQTVGSRDYWLELNANSAAALDPLAPAALLAAVARAFMKGDTVDTQAVAEHAGLPLSNTRKVLGALESASLVRRIAQAEGESGPDMWTLARPASAISLAQALDAVSPQASADEPAELQTLRKRQNDAFAGLTLEQLVEQDALREESSS